MTEIEQTLNQGFDRLIASMSIEHGRKLWNAEQVAEYFGVSSTTVYRSMLCVPSFPEAIKIVNGPKRWVSGEVIEWAESQRERRGKNAA
jgi:predicted DNA-binding transcriptional regulator AlpA